MDRICRVRVIAFSLALLSAACTNKQRKQIEADFPTLIHYFEKNSPDCSGGRCGHYNYEIYSTGEASGRPAQILKVYYDHGQGTTRIKQCVYAFFVSDVTRLSDTFISHQGETCRSDFLQSWYRAGGHSFTSHVKDTGYSGRIPGID
jgi:hypothetical protein